MLDCQDSVRQKVSTFSLFTEQCLTMPTRQRKELQEFKDAGWVEQSWRRRDIERRWRLWEKCRLERKKRSEKENDRVRTFPHGLFVYVSLGCHFSFHFFLLLFFFFAWVKYCWSFYWFAVDSLPFITFQTCTVQAIIVMAVILQGVPKCIKFKILQCTFTLVLQ